jgi:iron complex transport system substrate-binding protein
LKGKDGATEGIFAMENLIDNLHSRRRMSRGFKFILVSISVFLLLTGCGQESEEVSHSSPERIISMAPSITETLFALGLGERVIAVSNFCNFPEEAQERPLIGGVLNPNWEVIISLSPDLVIAPQSSNLEAGFKKYQIPSLFVRVDTLDDIFFALDKIGQATSKSDEAKIIIQNIKAEMEQTSQQVADFPRPKVLLVIAYQPLTAAGKGTYLDELITLAGGENILSKEEKGYPKVSMEEVVRRAPEIILNATFGSEKLDFWRRFGAIPAVKSGRIHNLESDSVVHPGPRVAEALQMIARLIHPEAFEENHSGGGGS